MIQIESFQVSPEEYCNSFDSIEHPRIETCPHCHAMKRLHLHGTYARNLVHRGKEYLIKLKRHLCTQCRKTVSILPDFCHPKFQYSVQDLIKTIFALLLGETMATRQLAIFHLNRFLSNSSLIIEWLRKYLCENIAFPCFKNERAIKLLKMVTGLTPTVFAKRYFDHFSKGFMAK